MKPYARALVRALREMAAPDEVTATEPLDTWPARFRLLAWSLLGLYSLGLLILVPVIHAQSSADWARHMAEMQSGMYRLEQNERSLQSLQDALAKMDAERHAQAMSLEARLVRLEIITDTSQKILYALAAGLLPIIGNAIRALAGALRSGRKAETV